MGAAEEALYAQLRERGIGERMLDALAAVPRQRFAPPGLGDRAYVNEPLRLSAGQTMSQPYVVARMCELLELRPGDRVLDVGAGSGWHAAVLAQLGGTVWAIERHAELARLAERNLTAAGIGGVTVIVGDGTLGWPEAAPYDAINVAAGARDHVPRALERQLADGGRLVAPVDDRLVLVRREGTALVTREHEGVRFVPLIGAG